MLDLSDDAMLCLMEFLPLSDILKLRLLSKSVYTFVTNLCGYCKLLKIYLPDTFLSSSGSQFHPQTTDYFLNSTKDVKIMFTRKMATFQEESIDLLDKCAHRVISVEDDRGEMFGVVPALVWKKITRLEDLNVSYIDEDGAKNLSDLVINNSDNLQKYESNYVDLNIMDGELKELQVLDITNNRNSVVQLVRCQDSKLREVKFLDCDLSSLELLDTQLKKLKKIEICTCLLSEAGFLNLITKCYESIECLVVGTQFSQIIPALNSIQFNMVSLTSLTIEAPFVLEQDPSFLELQNVLNCSPNLEQLDLKYIKISPENQMQLKPNKLKSLKIWSCQIFAQLPQILMSCNQHLMELDIITNCQDDQEFQLFFESQWYLPKLKNLKFRSFFDCKDSFIGHVPDDTVLNVKQAHRSGNSGMMFIID